MPLVYSKQPICSNSDHSRVGQTWLGVGCYMSDRGVGWELQNHDNILLSLVCEHQRTLQEEILLSAHNKNPNTWETKTWGGEEKTGQEKEDCIKTHKIQKQLQ